MFIFAGFFFQKQVSQNRLSQKLEYLLTPRSRRLRYQRSRMYDTLVGIFPVVLAARGGKNGKQIRVIVFLSHLL